MRALHCRRPGLARRRVASAIALCALVPPAVHADTGNSGTGALPRNTTASLDFNVTIGKLLFFRIGQAAWPAASTVQSTAAFTLSPAIPAVPTVPVTGSNQPVNWNGAVPFFTVSSAAQVLPVEVRSNAGTVSLNATATTPLTSASSIIPLSEILIASSDNSGLPAPLVPATGTGASVSVGATDYLPLVTVRTANWTFSYANAANRPAGSYTGQVTFTASTP